MGDNSKIQWTDRTWNPVRGCSLVSAGCANCYAMKQAHRFSGRGKPYEDLTELGPHGPRWNGNIMLVPEALEEPLRWKTPARVFVNSMSDLFHEDVPIKFISRVWLTMQLAPQHTFQILTKRPERMLAYMREFGHYEGKPLPNVWLGVSAENQETADERIPLLLQTPAAVRFVSAEPLLGPVSFRWAHWEPFNRDRVINHLDGLRRLDWVIAGGESGPGARPMHPEWARSIRDQCQAADVPFFFKQWGEWTPGENVIRRAGMIETATWWDGKWNVGRENLATDAGHRDDEPDLYRVGKKAAGAMLDGREWRQFPTKGARDE